MKRILSCMQPTNRLHLGNYLGALRNWVRLQDDGESECLYGVVDMHAITAGHDPAALAHSTREIAAAYIAAGVDPKRSSLFVQSAVPGHSQLQWLFACLTPLGWLNRMTQFKEKAGKKKDQASLGLYGYPVLMAADILIYKATHVPVGDDQKQHLELARDIAASFNQHYAGGEEFFVMPEPVITGEATRVMSLRNGTEKMSKSADSDMTRINLTDDADTIAQKIRKAKTDPHPVPGSAAEMEGRPEAANLIGIYAALSDTTKAEVMAQFGGKQFSDFKGALSDLAVEKLAPITARMSDLMRDPGEIDRILAAGNEKANALAAPTVEDTMKKLGFWG
ncbi:MAG: tryptophan--tRNA ligase [Rhodospirillales bacterium]|nr:tryptophan--tRNA ligase [Alphaproteobacteria bacterium]USO03532.1 MAG: tryptophan--tRNA ligase [Rhodospirillales bacterium]